MTHRALIPRRRTPTLGLLALASAGLFGALCAGPASARSGLPLVRVPAGSYLPLYAAGPVSTPLSVPSFLLMTRPVTNADYLAFVRSHPAYRRDRIAAVFAESSYLSHWAGPLALGPDARPLQPVTRVSWFAARAFCASHGLRLPLEREWELAAAASETQRDGRSDPTFRTRVLDWYATPNAKLPDVPHGPANVYGVSDLHGAVWEWVLDYGATLIPKDSRGRSGSASGQFCGGQGSVSGDRMDYAAFMRVAMRSSLEASYTSHRLGFRCAAGGSQLEDAP